MRDMYLLGPIFLQGWNSVALQYFNIYICTNGT